MKIYNINEINNNLIVNGHRKHINFTEYSNQTGEIIRNGVESVKVGSLNIYQISVNDGRCTHNGKRIFEKVCNVYTNTTPKYLKKILNENDGFWKIKKGGII